MKSSKFFLRFRTHSFGLRSGGPKWQKPYDHGPKHTGDLAQRLLHVDEIHDPESGDHDVWPQRDESVWSVEIEAKPQQILSMRRNPIRLFAPQTFLKSHRISQLPPKDFIASICAF